MGLGDKLSVIAVATLAVWSMLLANNWTSRTPHLKGLNEAKSIIWVIAHRCRLPDTVPRLWAADDEAFFFGPSLTNLLAPPGRDEEKSKRVYPAGHILSLSSNYEGHGEVRTAELKESCRMFAVDDDKCVVVHDPRLVDGPDQTWSADVINSIVAEKVKQWNADVIITFDPLGVSSHPNHASLGQTLLAAPSTFPQIYLVRTTPLPLKFTSLLLLPLKHLQHNIIPSSLIPFLPSLPGIGAIGSPSPRTVFLTSPPPSFILTRLAFDAHQSQQTWFRTLYALFSHYLWWIELVPREEYELTRGAQVGRLSAEGKTEL
ncbi:BZ3500_MvSof-1268-A1-R1_Chr10-1g02743 [Microbotryum saponariae]|uniref:N-acetylglucosaminylphosphatidylinositol deacetylase n=1 Tax=Microbotryum saponariae TaxID=289078 RepID=A0A2X0NF44_9BASI|nr:BZ3500_MvSof-1268-A1-R1_Chr10-1g02743 [Microbotryum saponariae]SDA06232.1 BZ3501_MvSof-1269-A2-R1_Chr10-1g02344 [Microbotryum saponariae]